MEVFAVIYEHAYEYHELREIFLSIDGAVDYISYDINENEGFKWKSLDEYSEDMEYFEVCSNGSIHYWICRRNLRD